MKKTLLVLSSFLLMGISFVGCQKKGANDPSISFHGRKARLCGDWVISAGTSTSTSGSTTQTDTWTSNTLTTVIGSTTTTGTNAKYNLSIVKDGTWKSDMSVTYTVGSSSVISTQTQSGIWNWTGGIGDVKKREQFLMKTLSSTSTQGSTTSISTYTGDSAPVTVYEIDQLKNKELIIIWTGTSTQGTSTSSDSGSMTFIQ